MHTFINICSFVSSAASIFCAHVMNKKSLHVVTLKHLKFITSFRKGSHVLHQTLFYILCEVDVILSRGHFYHLIYPAAISLAIIRILFIVTVSLSGHVHVCPRAVLWTVGSNGMVFCLMGWGGGRFMNAEVIAGNGYFHKLVLF